MGICLTRLINSPRAKHFVLIAFFILACRGNEAQAPSNQTPVILISIDTLRSDHLPAYGYKGVETPNLDAFRRDAILYEHAYSHVPLTLPSHATMLTGRLPADTGVRDNLGFTLRQDIPTLAELLRKNGYQTGAAVSSFVMRGSTGLSRGFDFYEDRIDAGTERLNPGAVQRSGIETARIAMDWMKANQDRPFFFLLHLFEPHTPYDPPEPFRARYAAAPYDGEIAAADAIVGSVLDFLKERDLYDRSFILILSDHGEGLMDHGEDEHGIFLYREAIQVPLLLKLPGSRLRGTTAATPVQLTDVFPTIAAETESRFETSGLHGESLLNFTGKETPRQIFSESWFAAIHFGWSDLHSLVDGRHHFIRAPAAELYEVRTDPAERNNIAPEERRTAAAMQRVLEPFIAPPAAPESIDPEEARKLAALGYLGATAPASSAPRHDPKSQLATLQEMKTAFGHFRDGNDGEAIPRLQKLVTENPQMLDMWDALARSLFRTHRYEESIQAAKQALRISPRSPQFAILISNAALELGRLDEALAHAELLETTRPAESHEIRARVYLAQKKHDLAAEHATLAARDDSQRLRALLTLARVENERGRPQHALKISAEIAAEMRTRKLEKLARYHFTRGDALARLGRTAEAESEFREEIRLFPRDPQAYRSLMFLYLAQRRPDDASEMLFELERNAPTPEAYLSIAETLKALGDHGGVRFWVRRGLQRFPDDARLRSLASIRQ